MNKLAIFDLDGVLCQLKDAHFEALNNALIKCGELPIRREDHLTRFDGLPTKKKLEMLGITGELAKRVDDIKQEETLAVLPAHVKPNPDLYKILERLALAGYKLSVVSNARLKTVTECLKLLNVHKWFSTVWTPSVQYSAKPAISMYVAAMQCHDSCPNTTIVFEDSPMGLRAAHNAGCKVVQVYDKLTEDMVMEAMEDYPQDYTYQWPELNVLIPAAGNGQRFVDAGYEKPKPFIDVNGKPMIGRVVDNLNVEANFIGIFQKKHLDDFCWMVWKPPIIDFATHAALDMITRGTAETCLKVKQQINNDSPLLIANSDQLMEWDHLAFYYFCQNTLLDGVLVVFDEVEKNPKWSYCELDANGLVKRVAEKEVISSLANTGLYFFKHGSDFVKYAERMIEQDLRVNKEFYVAPVFNLAIADGKKIGVFKVSKMHGLGTPIDLELYLATHAR